MPPPAPGRFSITIVCLSISSIFLVRMRAITSLGPPGVNATTSVTGRVGYAAAMAVAASNTEAAMARSGAIFLNTWLPRFLTLMLSDAGSAGPAQSPVRPR